MAFNGGLLACVAVPALVNFRQGSGESSKFTNEPVFMRFTTEAVFMGSY